MRKSLIIVFLLVLLAFGVYLVVVEITTNPTAESGPIQKEKLESIIKTAQKYREEGKVEKEARTL